MKRIGLVGAAALLVVTVAVLPFASASVAGGPEPQYFVDEATLPFTALPDATAYWGVHSGAGYRIEVPDDWNGDLVMWAHGFRGTGLDLTVDNHPLHEYLIENGFAWAASSYSRNDYDIQVGVQDTHALVERFNGVVGSPDKVYVTGASMGGHITAVSIEQNRATYDAALPVCGVLGDHDLLDYFLDFNVAAPELGTGSSTFPLDPFEYIGVTVPAIKANPESVPGGWPVFLNSDGEDLKGLTEQRSGGERPNFDEAWFFWNTFPEFGSGPGDFLFDLGLGDGTLTRAPGVAIDNSDTVYQFDSDPALTPAEVALNDEIFRVTADPQTRRANGLAQVPIISGDISLALRRG